jgi:hypothetical protein
VNCPGATAGWRLGSLRWHKADLIALVGVSTKAAVSGNVSVILLREVASLFALDIFPVSSRREFCRYAIEFPPKPEPALHFEARSCRISLLIPANRERQRPETGSLMTAFTAMLAGYILPTSGRVLWGYKIEAEIERSKG